MSEFWDTAGGWDAWEPTDAADNLYDAGGSHIGQYESSPELPVPPVAPDAELMTNALYVSNVFKGATGNDPYFGNLNSATVATEAKSGAVVKTGEPDGESMMQRLAKTMGFNKTEDLAKIALPAVGAMISGAASGYGKAQEAKVAAELAKSKAAVDQSTIAYNKSRTNQSGLENLKYTSGMINAPFKPAPFVRRTPT